MRPPFRRVARRTRTKATGRSMQAPQPARTLAALCPAASSAAPTSPTEIIVDGLCCYVNSSEKGNEKYKLPGELTPGMRSEIRPARMLASARARNWISLFFFLRKCNKPNTTTTNSVPNYSSFDFFNSKFDHSYYSKKLCKYCQI